MREKAAKAEKDAERQKVEDDKLKQRSLSTIHTGEMEREREREREMVVNSDISERSKALI